jgi:hypothetical protein
VLQEPHPTSRCHGGRHAQPLACQRTTFLTLAGTLADFLVDFDKLRKGEVYPANFLRGMSMAGVDKFLTAAELQVR